MPMCCAYMGSGAVCGRESKHEGPHKTAEDVIRDLRQQPETFAVPGLPEPHRLLRFGKPKAEVDYVLQGNGSVARADVYDEQSCLPIVTPPPKKRVLVVECEAPDWDIEKLVVTALNKCHQCFCVSKNDPDTTLTFRIEERD